MLKRSGSFFALLFALSSCGGESSDNRPYYDGPNPFTEELTDGKADTGFLANSGIEVHLTFEGDVEVDIYRIFDAPAYLLQYAFSALKRPEDDIYVAGHGFYAMALADGLVDDRNIEWLVDDEWLSGPAAREIVDRSKLRHFRAKEISAVVFNDTVYSVREGQVMEVVVPIRPYSIYSEVGNKCAMEYPGIRLSQIVYWFLWLPTWTCRQQTDIVQTMTVTVTKVLERPNTRYPEYDQLWSDGRLDAAVFFAKIDEKPSIEDDYNWKLADLFCNDLLASGFRECGTSSCDGQLLCSENCGASHLGRRFIGTASTHAVKLDIYHPNLFRSLSDMTNFKNWQKAVSENEVVIYLGHAGLGTGVAFSDVKYPDFYQIFMTFSCLSYSYYLQPVFTGKGGWEKVDVISLADLGKLQEMHPMTAHLIRGLMEGFEKGGRLSWQDLMARIGRAGRISKAAVSGVADNCFSPEGDLCNPDPDPDPDPDPEETRFENNDVIAIPDNDAAGMTSTIEVNESLLIGSLRVELNISHTYVGDLEIALSHGGTEVVIWNHEGNDADNIRQSSTLADWDGQDASGTWTLRISDNGHLDTGWLNSWALAIK